MTRLLSEELDVSVKLHLIETPEHLAEACEQWRRLEVVAIDTEFVRERTFYPALGLIQVADGVANYLVDAVAIEDLEPLAAILRDPAVTKVFHSCGEDLEVLYHRFGQFPRAVFDTQIAAAMTGWGASLGYGRLVSALFEVELPKDKTRTNWLRRPLSEAQKTYAALDVAYLIPACRRLRGELRRLGREDWVRQEIEALFDAERFLPDPENAYLRLGASRSLAPRPLALLRRLATWREEEARRRDLPRNFVVREKALIEVARRAPRTTNALRAIESLHPREIQRHGQTLLRFVRGALELSPEKLPQPRPALDLRPYRRQVEQLRKLSSELAEDLSLPRELVASRKTIEKLVRRVVAGKEPALPRELRGWRRDAIGERLLEVLREELRRS